jgi:hypothetical protein
VGSGGFCGVIEVGRGGFRGRDGVGRDGRGRLSGWETIVVVPRAAGGFGALVGGPAGIASDVSMNALICGAILDGPYPDTILGGRTMSHRAS